MSHEDENNLEESTEIDARELEMDEIDEEKGSNSVDDEKGNNDDDGDDDDDDDDDNDDEDEEEKEHKPEKGESGTYKENIRAVPVSESKSAHHAVSYADLCSLSASHRKIRSYSWLDKWDLMFKFKDTVLESLIDEPVFYFSLLAYGICRGCMALDITDTNDQYLVAVTSVGTVLSFMFVFTFTLQYTRYMSALQVATKNAGFIQDVVYQCRGYLTKDETHRITRYANAANFAAYTGLSDFHTVENFFLPSMKRYNLLTRHEMEVLLSYDISNSGMAGCKVMISWVNDVIHSCSGCENPSNVMHRIPSRLRQNFSDQFFFVAFSTPFIYLHFTYLCIIIYLPIFSFSLARNVASVGYGTLDLFNVLAVIFLCIFFLGLYKLSRDFQDPYGLNFVNIPIIEICNQTVVESFRIAAIINADEVEARAMELREKKNSNLDSDSCDDEQHTELGPGVWDIDALHDGMQDSAESASWRTPRALTHLDRRKLQKRASALRVNNQAMPSFM